MLTEEIKHSNQLQFMTLLSKLNIDLTELTKYLDKVDYFEKPATTAQYNSFAGGLCKYALDLYYELGPICNAYFPGKYTEEDIIKVALFRDLYRAELFESYMKNTKNEATGTWETTLAYRVKDGKDRPTFGDIGFSSYMIAKYFIEFTDEQIEAICYSSICNGFTADIHDVRRSYPLVALLTMADMAASYLQER